MVYGVLDKDIQRKLLSDPKLTLNSALDLALAEEAAVKQSTEIRETLPCTVNFMKPKVSRKNVQVCKSRQNNINPCHLCCNHHPYGGIQTY